MGGLPFGIPFNQPLFFSLSFCLVSPRNMVVVVPSRTEQKHLGRSPCLCPHMEPLRVLSSGWDRDVGMRQRRGRQLTHGALQLPSVGQPQHHGPRGHLSEAKSVRFQ